MTRHARTFWRVVGRGAVFFVILWRRELLLPFMNPGCFFIFAQTFGTPNQKKKRNVLLCLFGFLEDKGTQGLDSNEGAPVVVQTAVDKTQDREDAAPVAG